VVKYFVLMRKDCALSKLTEEQQADLFDWLTTGTYDDVLKRIAQPPPKGFGIKTHINSLFRFYKDRQAQIRARDFASLSEATHWEGEAPDEPYTGSPLPPGEESEVRDQAAPEFLSKSAIRNPKSGIENTQSFFNASQIAFAHSTYILAHSPLNPATYRAVSRTLHQHEDAALKREYLDIARQQLALGRGRLQLDRTQFEYNAARAALALLPELNAIDQLNNIDDEAKIWRVRDRLFGSAPLPNEKCSTLNVQSASHAAPPMPNEKRAMIDAPCNSTSASSDSVSSVPSVVKNDLK
jgi:hypothetical protein